MKALEIIRNCESVGVKVSVRGSNLRIDAPKGLPDSMKETLRQHKAEIIRALTEKPTITERLNKMISEGANFEIEVNDFQAFGVGNLERDFLNEQRKEVLCLLQQSFLQKHLFSQSPELLESFKMQVLERSAAVSDGESEIVFQAVCEVAAEWTEEILQR